MDWGWQRDGMGGGGGGAKLALRDPNPCPQLYSCKNVYLLGPCGGLLTHS